MSPLLAEAALSMDGMDHLTSLQRLFAARARSSDSDVGSSSEEDGPAPLAHERQEQAMDDERAPKRVPATPIASVQ